MRVLLDQESKSGIIVVLTVQLYGTQNTYNQHIYIIYSNTMQTTRRIFIDEL